MWRLVRAFITGPLSPLLLFVAAAAGIVAMLATPREEEPQIVVPMADVLVSFPGASAEEVEKLVATPLERLLWQVDGVEHVYSISRRDGAVVTVRFFVGEDRERALVRITSRIEAHRDSAPPGVSGWVVRPVEIDDVPIVTFSLWSRTADQGDLRRVGEELLARLEQVKSISKSGVLGGLPREVRVELDPEALAARALTPAAVVEQLAAADAALAAGRFSRLDRDVLVLAGPFVGQSSEVAGLVVGAFDGAPVLLGDVARVVDGPEEPLTVSRITFGPQCGRSDVRAGESFPAVTLSLSKQKGTNAVGVAERILEEAQILRRDVLPSDMQLDVTRNYGHSADEKVDELFGHLLLAIVTVVALVAYTLGWREGLIVAAAVPVTFALTLLVNQLAGYTINRVTLFALVLVLGLVCDDPIVDVENIHRHFARRARPPLQAVLAAVNEVRPPVIVATLAVILSFVPLFFITGMMGPYMRPMALNVPVAMGMSLLVAFTITPWMSYHLLRPREGSAVAGGGHVAQANHGEDGRLISAYRRLLGAILDRRGARLLLALGIAGLALFAAFLAASGAVPLKMLPYDNKSEFLAVLDLPAGSTLEATNRAVVDLERALADVPEVVNCQSYVGLAGPIDFNGLVRRYNLRAGPELAEVRVHLLPKAERAENSHDLLLRLRAGLEAVAARHSAELKLVEMPPGPPVLSTLVAEVRGPAARTHGELVAGAREVAARLELEQGVVDVDVMAEEPTTRLEFRVDKEKAALHGVVAADLVRVLRLALSGETAATVHEPGERGPLPLRVVLDRASRSGAAELGRLQVAGRSGALVAVAELGSFVEMPADQPIYHKDLERVVFVLGEVAGRPPVEAVLSMQSGLAQEPLPGNLEARWGGEGEWQITLDVFRDLGLAFLGALAGIYVLLVVQTRSFALPLLVMLAIPLGAIAIFPGFWLLNLVVGREVGGYGSPVWFTATGMIGMIALAGIVVRNSIILIDFVQSRLAEGSDPRQAVLDSGVQRLRPIVLTALAAMLGAWPITLDPIFSGLAWSLIFGVLASTVFTLFVIPVAYLLALQRRGATRDATTSGAVSA
jgi:multidrug efflux pump subunit AcrB